MCLVHCCPAVAEIWQIIKTKKKMAGRSIRVAVLEGDFAGLSAAGFPLSLCVQLQQSALKLPDALWTAKSSAGGFSVSFFWPSVSSQLCYDKKEKKKRRERGRPRPRAVLSVNLQVPKLLQNYSHHLLHLQLMPTLALKVKPSRTLKHLLPPKSMWKRA